MLKRVGVQMSCQRSSVFHIPALPSFSDHVQLAKVDLASTRLASKLTCTSRVANLGWEKSASSSLSLPRVPNKLPAQMLHMAGLPHTTDSLSAPRPISFDTRVSSNLQCSQFKRRGHIFPTSAPHKTIHGSSLLVSPIPLFNGFCSSQRYSTLTCPLLPRLLAEKSQPSLSIVPFSSAPSEGEKPKGTWGKLKQMVKDYW